MTDYPGKRPLIPKPLTSGGRTAILEKREGSAMEESRIDRLERAVIFLILGLLPLHLYLSFSNL